MATLTRGLVTLSPAVVLPARLTRTGRSVVHPIIGDTEPDLTSRAPDLRSGDLSLIFRTAAAAMAAVDALAVVGGSWTLDGSGECDGAWRITGSLGYEPAAEGVPSRLVTVTVQEAAP